MTMSSKKSPNYALHVWEPDDDFLREEFNQNTQVVDTALARKVELVTGAYTGDGAETRVIPLSRTPRAVLVMNQHGQVKYDINIYGGLALPGHPVQTIDTYDPIEVIAIVSGGFQVRQRAKATNDRPSANITGKVYHYLAFL